MNSMIKEELDVSVYVVRKSINTTNLVNEFMRYIGGQNKVQCSLHELPLIVSANDDRCYQYDKNLERVCNRKKYLICPDMRCLCGICKKCLNKCLNANVTKVDPPENIIMNDHSDTDSMADCCENERNYDELNDAEISNNLSENCQNLTQNCQNLTQNERQCEVINEGYNRDIDNQSDIDSCGTDDVSLNDEMLTLLQPMENDNIDDFVMMSEDPDIPDDNIVNEYFPTTNSGENAFIVREEIPKGHYVSGHF